MGTETKRIIYRLIPIFRHLVKLNNPLMGTETFCKFHELYIRVDNVVKLNNPLMGTETVDFFMINLTF